MKGFCAIILSATVTAAVIGGPVAAAQNSPASTSCRETPADVLEAHLPDPHKDLRRLSKSLKLNREQLTGVDVILQERTREICLLLEIEPLSQEFRNKLAAKVMDDSDIQIETLLKSKQKRKFHKELAKDRETHSHCRQLAPT